MKKLLIIDDSTAFLRDVESLLGQQYEIATATSGRQGLALLQKETVSAVLLDLRMPDMDGTEVLAKIRTQIDPHLPVIIVTDQGEVDTAVKAMQLGAYDFIPKSFNLELLTAKIRKALERRTLELNVTALQGAQAEQYDRMIFASEKMKKVHFEISRLAGLNFDVLLIGETGAGKDLIAFEIHRRGPRQDHPFIHVPMKTLNETLIESELFGHEKGAFSGAERAKVGKLEAAAGGTLYLPEISTLTEPIQLKLLQFMQYKTIARVGQDPRRPPQKLDVRIIMATNDSLEDQVKRGNLREDFYHRITGIRLAVPPLRERVEDIEPLARYFLQKHGAELGAGDLSIEAGALESMQKYRWPGNVRELENMIKSAIAYNADGVLRRADFPHLNEAGPEQDKCRACFASSFPSLPPYHEIEASFRRAYFDEAMKRSGNVVSKAAAVAGVTAQGFRKVMKGLENPDR